MIKKSIEVHNEQVCQRCGEELITVYGVGFGRFYQENREKIIFRRCIRCTWQHNEPVPRLNFVDYPELEGELLCYLRGFLDENGDSNCEHSKMIFSNILENLDDIAEVLARYHNLDKEKGE